ncbi:MAG: cysteine desulfurase family protein [Rhabdochlamydiaceae bacterium]|nr:cysteine desulfurase family protein [Candidatus Amphrikana amoebophyrae]
MKSNPFIYFDNNATTSCAKEVILAMEKEIRLGPSNPSSIHKFGREAKKRLYRARSHIASYLNVFPSELVFTSGGTESLNLVIRGFAHLGDIITTKIEHASLYNTVRLVKSEDQIHYVEVDEKGVATIEAIQSKITPKTKLLILSAVNSETGAMLNLEAIAQLAENESLILIIDGVALLGKEAFTIPSGVSAMVFSAHKFHGPKGVGFHYINEFAPPIKSFQVGGSQESTKRAGTENLLGIMGLEAAILRLQFKQLDITNHLLNLRTRFENSIFEQIKGCKVNGSSKRVCNTSNIFFEDIDAETLLILLDQNNIMASHGSACSSGALEPSRVLLNMGYSKKRAKQSIRFSFSVDNTMEEVDIVIKTLSSIITQMRKNLTLVK